MLKCTDTHIKLLTGHQGIFSKLWHHAQVWEKFICLFDERSPSSLTGSAQHTQVLTISFKLLDLTLHNGLSDGLSTPPPPSIVHTVMKYDLISVSAAASVTPLASQPQTLPLQFPLCLFPLYLFGLFPSHLCRLYLPESLIQPPNKESVSPWREIA